MSAPFDLPQPGEAPDWAFSYDQDLKCPECDVKLAGLNWGKSEDGGTSVSMNLIPCGHVLDMDVWELKYSGRDRVIGTVIRKPTFVRKAV